MDRYMLATIVNSNRQAHHFGQNHGTTRPRLDRTLVALFRSLLHFLEQMQINKWTFFQGAWHFSFLFLAILCRRLSLVAVTNDHIACALVLARLVTFGGHAPGSHRVTTTGGSALTTAMGVVDGVHGHTANGGTHTAPALRTGFTQRPQTVLTVGHLAQRGTAVGRHLAHLARTQAQGSVLPFAGDQLDRGAGAARQLSTFARLHLHTVDGAAHGDIAQRQRIAHLDRRSGPGLQQVSCLDPLGRNDVAAFAVLVTDQGDIGGAVGIVFDTLDLTDNAILVALEIDHPVVMLVTTTHMAGSNPARVVATSRLALLFEKRRIGRALVQVRIDDADNKAATRRCWLSFDYRHVNTPYSAVAKSIS